MLAGLGVAAGPSLVRPAQTGPERQRWSSDSGCVMTLLTTPTAGDDDRMQVLTAQPDLAHRLQPHPQSVTLWACIATPDARTVIFFRCPLVVQCGVETFAANRARCTDALSCPNIFGVGLNIVGEECINANLAAERELKPSFSPREPPRVIQCYASSLLGNRCVFCHQLPR